MKMLLVLTAILIPSIAEAAEFELTLKDGEKLKIVQKPSIASIKSAKRGECSADIGTKSDGKVFLLQDCIDGQGWIFQRWIYLDITPGQMKAIGNAPISFQAKDNDNGLTHSYSASLVRLK